MLDVKLNIVFVVREFFFAIVCPNLIYFVFDPLTPSPNAILQLGANSVTECHFAISRCPVAKVSQYSCVFHLLECAVAGEYLIA